MSDLSSHHGAAGFGDDEMWAGVDRSDRCVVSEDDVPNDWRILAILGVYGTILCLGVVLLAV